MEIYRLKSFWKLGLAVAGILIILFSIGYAQYLAQRIRHFEHQKITWFKTAIEDYQTEEGGSFILHDAIITADLQVPLILVNERGAIESARHYGTEKEADMAFLEQRLADIRQSGYPPLELRDGKKIYYEDSFLVAQLRYLPLVQVFLIGSLIFLGYLGFHASRKAEENRIWIGMARETAHQLGTPLSAILAWIEYLRQHAGENDHVRFATTEIARDAEKLDLIADRFSKIGATPELEDTNVLACLDQMRRYMEARSPKKVIYHFPEPDAPPLTARLNVHLFEWVLENLLRNALDAMEGEGEIRAVVFADARWVHIEISDTGKGIPSRRFRRVFKPGFTTKPRGWGLGLSLAKRIVESYHKGRIFVKSSVPGKGTTFAILLPRTTGGTAPATAPLPNG
ncbi:MAG: HAMP domain-containing histidine kinase [Saprospiraceae bacterium]|nr:HAMP domain-containing histidine kinase [Saprospiraceae bacterium]